MSFTTMIENATAKLEAYNEKNRNGAPKTRLDSIFGMGLILTVLYLATAGYKDFLTDLPWSEVRSFYITAQHAAIGTLVVHIINAAIKDLREGK